MNKRINPCFEPPAPGRAPIRTAWLGAFLLGLALQLGPGHGRAAEPASRITQVTVYPGSALVERSARVTQGTKQLVLPCLSASFDLQQLRLDADAGIRLGPVSAVTLPREHAPACNTSVHDARIRELEDQLAAIAAENDAQALVLGYLKSLSAAEASASAARPGGVTGAAQLAGTVDALKKLSQDALQQQHRLARQREVLEAELNPLRSERDRQLSPAVRTVTLSLSAVRDGHVRLRYEVAGPTWAPAYRATLDPATRSVQMERLALVSQASGEDWQGVNLRLSTGSPRAGVAGPRPRPWEFSIRSPYPEPLAQSMAAPAPPVAMLAQRSKAAPMADLAVVAAEEPAFEVQVVEGQFNTEFEVPGQVTLEANNQRVGFPLGTSTLDARLKARATPASDGAAYLIAEIRRPDGIWPDGPLQLIRGTQLVGSSVWRSGERDTISLPFGRDEQVRVQVNPVQQMKGSSGFIGNKTERQIGRVYLIENRHNRPIELQVLEATPVSTDERISVSRKLTPAPTLESWEDQPGVVAWEQTLGIGATARFSADYVISYPKDSAISERR